MAEQEAGGIDLLVNNAGIAGPTARLEEQPLDGWAATIDINLNGTFHMTRAAIPLLRARAPGSAIINMSSNAGLFGCPLHGRYVARKWAIIGLTKTLAMELGPEGIRANAICPGSVAGERIDRSSPPMPLRAISRPKRSSANTSASPRCAALPKPKMWLRWCLI